MYYQVFHDARPSLARVRALAWGRVGVRAGIRVTVRVRDRVRFRVKVSVRIRIRVRVGRRPLAI